MRGPAIVFDNVSLRLGGTQVLEDISFRVEAGALHCLVGPNGGGKTSLVRALLGQMPHSGTVRFEGEVTTPVGYVPQLPDFDRNLPMTVNDLMALLGQRRPAFLGSNRSAKAANAEALSRTGVAGMGAKPLWQPVRWPAPARAAGPGDQPGALAVDPRRTNRRHRRIGRAAGGGAGGRVARPWRHYPVDQP